MRKTLIAMLALAVAVAFSPLSDLQAAGLVGPGSKLEADGVTHVVKAKKKGKKAVKKGKKGKKAKRGKRAKSKGPGRCGTYMYYSKKSRKCLDARNKK
jgi:hypothetical protein